MSVLFVFYQRQVISDRAGACVHSVIKTHQGYVIGALNAALGHRLPRRGYQLKLFVTSIVAMCSYVGMEIV